MDFITLSAVILFLACSGSSRRLGGKRFAIAFAASIIPFESALDAVFVRSLFSSPCGAPATGWLSLSSDNSCGSADAPFDLGDCAPIVPPHPLKPSETTQNATVTLVITESRNIMPQPFFERALKHGCMTAPQIPISLLSLEMVYPYSKHSARMPFRSRRCTSLYSACSVCVSKSGYGRLESSVVQAVKIHYRPTIASELSKKLTRSNKSCNSRASRLSSRWIQPLKSLKNARPSRFGHSQRI
jgi:hypothetical protein